MSFNPRCTRGKSSGPFKGCRETFERAVLESRSISSFHELDA
jgi:hypothetical protein